MIYILIPIYNGIEFIDTAVTSIINQTYKDWKVLIGVNGHEANSSVYNTATKYSSEKYKKSLNHRWRICRMRDSSRIIKNR